MYRPAQKRSRNDDVDYYDNEKKKQTPIMPKRKCPPQFRCRPCKLDCWRQEWLDSHLGGPRHHLVVVDGWNVEDLPPKFYKKCYDCDWAGYSVEGWMEHVKSDNHRLRVAARPQPGQMVLGSPLVNDRGYPIADTYYKYYRPDYQPHQQDRRPSGRQDQYNLREGEEEGERGEEETTGAGGEDDDYYEDN